jgi:hypothetical protein
MDTGRVTPDHCTCRARQFDNASVSQIEQMQQAHKLNLQIPEFQQRNIVERQRSEQVGMHTERSMVNNPNQEN